MPPSVMTKIDFVRRYVAGEFGNYSPTWNTLEEYLASSWTGLVHVRNRITAGQTWYNTTRERVTDVWKRGERLYGTGNLYISVMGPEDKKVFQGEVQYGIWGRDLYYNTRALPMRDVPACDWSSVNGLTAKLLLQRYLCTNSYDWMTYLLDTYPFHVVEFSTYSIDWGTLPGFNTIFWEVRRY